MLHRPKKKVSRSPVTMIIAALLNIVLAFLFWFVVLKITTNPGRLINNGSQSVLIILSMILFLLSVGFFLFLTCLNPGFVIKEFNFVELIERSLEHGIHLDNLCVYDEIIKSETSFHCNFERRCVEMFDHHCPFINNFI